MKEQTNSQHLQTVAVLPHVVKVFESVEKRKDDQIDKF